MRPLKAECVQVANAVLGESPLWDTDQGALYWVDTKRPAIYRYEPQRGQTAQWPMQEEAGCIGFAGKGRLVFAGAAGIGLLELGMGRLNTISNPESYLGENQFNDGKVDRAGRFWSAR
jgi:sugar lactone lactonase YvrE